MTTTLRLRHYAAVAAMTATLAACAQRPDAIAATPLGGAFAGTDCASAASLYNAERQHLASLSSAQNAAANGDALGVFLLGIPTSSLTGGDKAGAIAASKGCLTVTLTSSR